MQEHRFVTPSGISVIRKITPIPYEQGLDDLLHRMDRQRGIYLSSGYEYPGRYSRWDVASVCPALEIIAFERTVDFRPLNERGKTINGLLFPVLENHPHWEGVELSDGAIHGVLKPLPALFPEEERSKQPSVFSIIRALIREFGVGGDPRLVLVGAFGFGLLYRFDPIEQRLPGRRVPGEDPRWFARRGVPVPGNWD
jgi:anthranilate synthase